MQNLRSHEKCALSIQIPYSSGHTETPNNNRQIQCSEEKRHALKSRFVFRQVEHGVVIRIVQRVSQTRLECRAELLIKYHLISKRSPHHFQISSCLCAADEPGALVPKQDGGGTPFAVSNSSPIEEVREASKPRVKAGATGREGNNAFSLAASAIVCTASLGTIVIHLGLRGVIPRSPSHALTAFSNVSSFPYCRVGCPATAAVRAPIVSEELCRTCVLLPAAAVRSRLSLAPLICRPTA